MISLRRFSIWSVPSRFIHYYYDPAGNKTGEAVRYGTGGSAYYNHRWYVRDAQGNTLATYEVNNVAGAAAGTLTLAEHHMYGSSRLGIIRRSLDMDQDKVTPVQETQLGNTYLLNFTRGNKLFEVTNHLGNVVMVLADLRTDKPRSNNPALVGNYNSVMVYASDYTPFGRAMAGRGYKTPTNYRYGFNGKEYHNDVQAAGNLLDYGNRLYDPMVGRFWSVDPITSQFPELTPYQFASNSPIASIDLDGKESKYYVIEMEHLRNGKTVIRNITEDQTKRVDWNNLNFRGPLKHGSLFTIKHFGPEGQAFYKTTYAFQQDPAWYEDALFKGVARQGGFVFSSKNGAGADNSLTPSAFHPDLVEADLLFSALQTANSANSNESFKGVLKELVESDGVLKSLKNSVEIFKATADGINVVSDQGKALIDLNNNFPAESSPKKSIRDTIERQGTWDFYHRNPDGSFKESRRTSAKDTLIKGLKGAPDTNRNVQFTTPPVPN